jgi:PAS domain S-box-containing protein
MLGRSRLLDTAPRSVAPRGERPYPIGTMGVIAGLLLILLAVVAAIVSFYAHERAGQWVSHTHQVTQLLAGILSQLQDTETGQRGYVITGDERYLEPYDQAVREVVPTLDRLGQLTTDNPSQQERVALLRPLVVTRLVLLKEGIEARRTHGIDAAQKIISSGQGKATMDRIRTVVGEMKQEELRLLAEREAVANQRQRWLLISTIAGSALGVLLVAGSTISAGRSRRAALSAYAQLRQSQAQVRASETRYRRLFEAARDGVLLLDPQTHRITDANPFMAELLGYSRDEMVGKELFEIGLARDAQASQAAFRHLEGTGDIHYEDLPLQTKDGDIREVEVVSNLYEEDGRPVIQCNIRDITARKRAEGALRDSELRYRTLFDSIDEGFCIIEVIFDENDKPIDYRFLETNPSFEKQTGLIDAQGKRMRELAPKHEEHWFEIYGRIALTGQPARFQNRAEQLHRWYDVYAFRLDRPENRHVAILFNDITERKRTEEALQAANQELTDFATIVSHDLKTPLRAVSTLAKWMQSDYADKLDEEGRQNLTEMVKRVGRMDRMIDDILAYSRLGRAQENPEAVALADLVSSVVQDLAPPAQVRVHIADSLPVVYGEPVRLRQLFQNLIGNAIKYGDKPQVEVRVDCADLGLFWQFAVADNGPGIEERHFERIFRIFQTLASKDKTDSTGVGLALVKRIVERAGGGVWVESRMGEGSTFKFTWPKAGVYGGEPAALQPSLSDHQTHSGGRA